MADPELCAAMGQSGRDYVVSRYGWDTVLDDYERLIHAAINRRRAAAVTSVPR